MGPLKSVGVFYIFIIIPALVDSLHFLLLYECGDSIAVLYEETFVDITL